jgi:type IV pilus assembly protein PilV
MTPPRLARQSARRPPQGRLLYPSARRQSGIALLEALIAVVILGIGLLGMIGLQARAYAALSDASMRAEATMAGEKLLGVMNTDIANLANYSLAEGAAPNATLAPWVQETQRMIPGALLSVRVQPQDHQSQVDIGIRWQRKAASQQNRHVVTAYIAN